MTYRTLLKGIPDISPDFLAAGHERDEIKVFLQLFLI
jgi:hypothetical protein